ncbi:hypothetical protein E4U41_002243 [Claviceps citrina]|nr:hypothetical protein E4U41_002243 [Claviceps citrina]
MLLCLALSIHAAPADPDKHAHQAVHPKRWDMLGNNGHGHGHAHAWAHVAPADRYYGERDGIAPEGV